MWWRKAYREQPPPKRGSEVGEQLTEEEKNDTYSNRCPDCGSKGSFLEGPHGGLAVNFKCGHCDASFNDMGPFGIERLSKGAPLEVKDG